MRFLGIPMPKCYVRRLSENAREFEGRGIVVRPFTPRIDVETAILHSAQLALSGLAREFIAEFGPAIAGFADQQRSRLAGKGRERRAAG